MKTSAITLSFSAVILTVAGLGFNLHAHAKPSVPALTAPVHTAAKAEDADLVGVIGDVLVDGCKSGDARCSKAWKDLGGLAGKDSL